MPVRETPLAQGSNILAALMSALSGGDGFALVERNGELFLEPSVAAG